MVVRMVELGCHALRKEIRPPAMSWIRIFWRKHRPRRFQVLVHITNWAAGQHLNTWISSQQKRKQHSFDAHRISAPGQDLNIWMGPQARHIRSDGPSVRIWPQAMPELIEVPDRN